MSNGIDKTALFDTIDAVKNEPALGNVSFNLSSVWQGGCRQASTTSTLIQNNSTVESRNVSYSLESDEPVALLGTDTAASPAEFILQALAGCYAVTFASLATARDITIDSLKFHLSCDIDLQGFLNINDDIRPGISDIRVNVYAKSRSSSKEELDELVRDVEQRSPIRDTLVNPVNVTTTLMDN
jgi:uncharacterized OsmC-like protein